MRKLVHSQNKNTYYNKIETHLKVHKNKRRNSKR